MKPPAFDYARPNSIEEAVGVLSKHGMEAKVLAGGQSLIPMMKLRLARPAVLVDINRIPALDYVRFGKDFVALGATVRQHLLESGELASRCPLLGDAFRFIGHEATRNRGTLCGSLAHADPTAEAPVVACCLDAELVAQGPLGTRTISARDFFVSFFATSLEADEMLVEVRLPSMRTATGYAFLEFGVRHAKFGLVAVTLRRLPNGSIAEARITMGAVAERPVRADETELELIGQVGSHEVFRAAAASAVARLDPPSDVHGSGKFRKQVARSLVERALGQAWQHSAVSGLEAG